VPRPHPFDFTFGAVADQWFGEIRSVAEAAGRDLLDLAQFVRVAPVERILAEMQSEGADAATAEAAEEYARLLYAGYHFWAGGRVTRTLSRDALERDLQAATPAPGLPAHVSLPAYVRLPENRFWGQLAEGQPHEPMDGFFVVAGGGARVEWLVVAVLGLREDRDGFSQISVTATSGDLLAATPERRPLLAPAMPGGSAAGFHSVTSVADLLLLVRLALVSPGQ
jgi:hypothetical protein